VPIYFLLFRQVNPESGTQYGRQHIMDSKLQHHVATWYLRYEAILKRGLADREQCRFTIELVMHTVQLVPFALSRTGRRASLHGHAPIHDVHNAIRGS